MTTRKLIIITIEVILLMLVYIEPSNIYASDFIPDDSGIQKIYQDGKIPHLSKSGSIQYSYNENSFFPRGLYHVDLGRNSKHWNLLGLNDSLSRDTADQVRDAGFNLVYLDGDFPTVQELDYLQNHGLKLYATVTTVASSKDLLIQSINQIKNHHALLSYMLFDENPLNLNLAQWSDVYQTIRSLDPNHPIYPSGTAGGENQDQEYGCTFEETNFADISDVLQYNMYPIYSSDSSLSLMTSRIDQARNVCQNSSFKPFIFVYQAFHNNALKRPSRSQLRGMIYSSIVHGAVGIFGYNQHTPWKWRSVIGDVPYNQDYVGGGISPEVTPDLWNAVSQTNREIDTYADVLLAKTATDIYHVFRTSTGISEHPLHTILKEKPNDPSRYLLALNIDGAPLEGKFSFGREILDVKSFLDGRILEPDKHSFSDAFGEYGVRLYRIVFKQEQTISPSVTNVYLCQTKSRGDANCDGKINEADYGIWKEEMKNMTSLYADYNSD